MKKPETPITAPVQGMAHAAILHRWPYCTGGRIAHQHKVDAAEPVRHHEEKRQELELSISRLYFGIADGMPIARAWVCRYSE